MRDQNNDAKPGGDDRLRQHPAKRFAASQHAFDLRAAVKELADEDAVSSQGHRQKTLYRHGKATIALFRFSAGAGLASHKAAGTVTIHVLDGRMRITTDEGEHQLSAGQLLILASGVEHDVHALEPSTMLLQVHLD